MPKSKIPKGNKQSRKVEQEVSAEMRQPRHDVSLPWDKEWLRQSRDDRPLSDQPMPENPLTLLKKKGLTPKNGTEAGKSENNETGGS